MPLVTIHTSNRVQTKSLSKISDTFAVCVSKQLSTTDRTLSPSEVSIRIIESAHCNPIADIEVVIIAYHYPARVKDQDQICLIFKEFIEQSCPSLNAFVWLQLSELGHSALN